MKKFKKNSVLKLRTDGEIGIFNSIRYWWEISMKFSFKVIVEPDNSKKSAYNVVLKVVGRDDLDEYVIPSINLEEINQEN